MLVGFTFIVATIKSAEAMIIASAGFAEGIGEGEGKVTPGGVVRGDVGGG